MKLKPLNDEENQILQRVVEEFYVALPPALQVHSLFATHVLSNTLHRFGIRTRVLPCRLWCSSLQPPLPHPREVVGGLVNYGNPEKWNGHVVCLVGDWLVDAALYHLNPAFNYEVPKIIARRIHRPEPGMYTSYRLNRTTEFIWYRLPPKVAAVPITGYEDFIERFVNDLVAHIRRLLGYEDEVPADVPAEDDSALSAEALAEDAVLDVADGESAEAGDAPLAEGDAATQANELSDPASGVEDDSAATATEAEPVAA